MRTARVAALSALLASLLAAPACFKPTYNDRAFFCSDGGLCPGSLTCDKQHNPPLCVSHIDGGAGLGGMGGQGGGGKGGEAGHFDGGVVDAQDAIDAPCVGPVSAACERSDAGLCDPVCNTGCGQCYQKCSVDPAGALTCNTPYMPSSPLVGVLADQCQTMQTTGDLSTRTDNCQAGSACIMRTCGSRCYKFCRTSNDCPTGASCTIDAGGGNSFCDVSVTTCDPVQGAATSVSHSGCPGGATQSCYLSSDTGNTVCDCYNLNTGFPLHHSCTHARDCFGGLTCTDPFGMGKACYKVCRLPGDGGTDLTRPDAGEKGCEVSTCTPILLTATGATTVTYGVCPE